MLGNSIRTKTKKILGSKITLSEDEGLCHLLRGNTWKMFRNNNHNYCNEVDLTILLTLE